MSVFETRRMILRELTPDDAPAMCALNRDPLVMRDMPVPEDNSIDAERARLARYVEGAYRTDGFGLWAAVLRASNRIIGRCGLLRQSVDGSDEIEMSYQIASAFQGRGLATEAASAIRDFAFQSLQLTRLIALVPCDHPASRRVAEKTGMRRERELVWRGKRIQLYAIARKRL